MAKKLSADDGKTTAHKANDVRAIIKSAAGKIIALKAEIAGLREDMATVKGELKGAGITLADFNAALRLYELEGEERDTAIDNIRICCEALGIGEQGSLFPEGAAEAPAKAGGDGWAGKKAAAYHLGRKTWEDGGEENACPADWEEPLRVEFMRGFKDRGDEGATGAQH